MLKFKRFTKKDYDLVSSFTKNSPYKICDYSLGVMLMWDKDFNYEIAISNNTLIVLIKMGKRVCFLLPRGENLEQAFKEIEDYATINELSLEYTCVPDECISLLKERYNGKIKITQNRNWSDYLYDIEEIKTFFGKKFSGQRNHINKFKKCYKNYEFCKLTAKDKPKIRKFLEKYKLEHSDMKGIEVKEYENTLKIIDNLDKYNFVGGYLKVNNKIASFTVGEYMGETLVIHIEKALRKYVGVYPTTFNLFVNFIDNKNIKYVNREDDSGDMGLRTSKLQYQPIEIVSKNYIQVEKPMGSLKKPTLKGKNVKLCSLKKEDSVYYYRLYTLKNNNKFWGYDYKKDIKELNYDSFYKMQLKDYKDKNNMVLKVERINTKEFMGEVILYNFSYDNKVEIGIRLFKKYQNKGYAKESVNLIVDYIENKLFKIPVMKCYKENVVSYNLIKKLGFNLEKEDEKYYYFRH